MPYAQWDQVSQQWVPISATIPGMATNNEKGSELSDVIPRPIAKGTFDNGVIEIACERSDDFRNLFIKIGEKNIATLTADKEGIVKFELREQDDVIFTGDHMASPEEITGIDSAWLEEQGTNWRVEKATAKKSGNVVFTYPKTGASIELPVASSPDIFTPKNTFPVYGQPEMLFALAMGIKHNRHTNLSGPTGTGKTTAYQFIAELMNANFIRVQIDPKTEGASLVGEYLPAGTGTFEWCDGPVTEAVRLSMNHPTILILDEISRIGNVAELARLYSLLDDSRRLTLPERRHELGKPEILEAGELYIGATMNPADDAGADYIGVRELDPALMSRFSFVPEIKYPSAEIELKTLRARVPGLSLAHAERMVKAANRVRISAEIHYPFSFRELVAWAEAIPYYAYKDAAEVAVIKKANFHYQPTLRNDISLD